MSLAFSDPRHLVPLARAAEEAGFFGVSLSDHVVHPERIRTAYPYTPDGAPRWNDETPWPDPLVAIGALGTATERIRFLTQVFVLPLRNPLLAAKAISTADVLCGGRLLLGIGVGWMREEFELAGQPFPGRGRRCDEMVEVLRKLFTGEMVEHRGEFYRFDRLRMLPRPVGEVPLLVGGLSDPALRRAARVGDGWLSDLHTTEELRSICARLHALRREYGREDRPFHVVGAAIDAAGPDGYRRLRDAGVTHVLTMPWVFYGGMTESLEKKCDGIRRFGEEVISRLRQEA